MNEIFVGRQPIYDRKQGVYAYELLFRSTHINAADITDGDRATSDVIVNTFMEIGLDNIVGDKLAFINLTRSFFVDEMTISLPKDRVVLELLEDIEADEDVVAGVTRLIEQGYSIALDDFIYHESLQPLVELADIIKIDVMALSQDEIRDHVEQLRQHPLRLLAEKVETRDDYDFCMGLGFDYFQGYFFAQPKIIRSQRLPNNRLAILKLMSRLQDPEITPTELENLIVQDVAFSFKILRYVNSAAVAMPRKIESIQQAVVILGMTTIRSWTTLLAMSQIDDKPAELVVTAMIRAKMAENMALTRKESGSDVYFTVGLFSALDALMDNSMEEILTQLPLADHISDALLHHKGSHGKTLACVLAYERGQWEHIHCQILDATQIRDAYLSAVRWANEICQTLIKG
ncbi:Predicted signal transduction protein [hydrothermal vent metagenome]|uniref:Predicted signal transduction protein n=1 Tax=hydrothermal vent metagenome TaxID=652676 RepID=A0A3B0ZHC6_9ZZZZ